MVKRRIFFWSLVAVFFVVAPAVILYARGFRFDPERGVFVHSGSITIKSNPLLIDIELNDAINDSKKLNRINNSYHLNGLVPGTYNLEISAPDFQTWTKKWEVHSGISTEFWNVLLVRKNYERTDYPTQDADHFFISPEDDLLAFTKPAENGLIVSIMDIADKAADITFEILDWSFIEEKRRENIEWSPDQNFISIPVQRNEEIDKRGYQYFIADINGGSLISLNEFLGRKDIQDVRWDPVEKGYLFFLEGGSLFRANIADVSDITNVVSDVTSYDLSGRTVYFIQKSNNLVFKTSLDGLSEHSQITSDFPAAEQTISRMIVYSEEEISFISDKGDFFIYNEGEHDTYFRKLGSGVSGSHFSNDGKKLLFWTDNEISTYFVRDWEVQPIRNENEMINITRYSEPIRNVQWYKDFEHVIFTSGQYVKTIELDSRDRRNTMDILATAIGDPFVIYSGDQEKLFLTDMSLGSGFRTIQSIIFPEQTPLLGLGG